METQKHLSRVTFFLLIFDMIALAACQYCSQFVSPMALSTDGSRVGIIQIPLSGQTYKSNQRCEWTIETEESGYGIQLDVVSCSLQGRDLSDSCSSDYVDVFDSINGGTILIGRFCESDKGKSYRTASNKMIVRFQSNEVLEYAGFQASYQAVLVDSDEGDEPETIVLGLAVGIPVGVLALAVVIILTVSIIRHHRRKKAAATTQATTSTANNNFSRVGLPGGRPSQDVSQSDGSHRMYNDVPVGRSTDLDHYSRNIPLEVILLRNFQEDARNVPWNSHEDLSYTRSVTPPPPYDSLDFAEVGGNRMSLSPPSYEMVVKYSIESSTV